MARQATGLEEIFAKDMSEVFCYVGSLTVTNLWYRREKLCMCGVRVYLGLSVLSTQFGCEPKTALKIVLNMIKPMHHTTKEGFYEAPEKSGLIQPLVGC